MVRKVLFILIILTSSFLTNVSVAHHFIEGEVPENFLQGLISGIAHPIIGIDHLVFLIFTTLIVYLISKKIFFISLFIFSTVLGSLLTIININLPILELSIIISILLTGVSFFIYKNISNSILLLIFIIFGIFHGNAYGKTIIEALAPIQVSYIIGLVLVQFLVCIIIFNLAKFLINSNEKETYTPYFFGLLNISAGITILYIYF